MRVYFSQVFVEGVPTWRCRRHWSRGKSNKVLQQSQSGERKLHVERASIVFRCTAFYVSRFAKVFERLLRNQKDTRQKTL